MLRCWTRLLLMISKCIIFHRVMGKTVAKDSVQVMLGNGYKLKPAKRLQSFVNDRDSIFFTIDGTWRGVACAQDILPTPPHELLCCTESTSKHSKAETPATKAPKEPLTRVTASSKYTPHASTPAVPSVPRPATTLPPGTTLDKPTIDTLLKGAGREANEHGNVAGGLSMCTAV